jgi:SAM-dependent methyltransferase
MSKTNQGIDATSLERIVPDELHADEATGGDTLRLHWERYQFAKEHLVPGSVLDMACGVGYGTALLSENECVTSAVGVDMSCSAIEYAKQRYGNEHVAYACLDALQFSSRRRFENIVSLETIEHVDDPAALFLHLVSLLAPAGRLIVSVPVTPSVDANPHHKSNFSVRRFRDMGHVSGLKYVDSLTQKQPFSPLAIPLRKEKRAANMRHNMAAFYFRHPLHLWLRLWSTLRDGFVNK